MEQQAEVFAAGNYRYVPSGVMQYSGGAAAMPGYAIRRVVFSRPVPLTEGFERIAQWLQAESRPLTALCGCELRSPGQFSEAGFTRFNTEYVGTLQAWGIASDTVNPVPRSNVCPQVDPPAVPSFYAFSYTVPSQDDERSFVVAGSSVSERLQAMDTSGIERLASGQDWWREGPPGHSASPAA